MSLSNSRYFFPFPSLSSFPLSSYFSHNPRFECSIVYMYNNGSTTIRLFFIFILTRRLRVPPSASPGLFYLFHFFFFLRIFPHTSCTYSVTTATHPRKKKKYQNFYFFRVFLSFFAPLYFFSCVAVLCLRLVVRVAALAIFFLSLCERIGALSFELCETPKRYCI